MGNLSENIYYKKATKIKPKIYVILFVVLFVFFLIQFLFIHLLYIPKILERYNEFPTVQNQVQLVLDKIASTYVIWPILFFTLLGIMVYDVINIQKLIKSIDGNK